MKDTYLINLLQICCVNLASTNYHKLRQITGCSKSSLIIINENKHKSLIVNPDIMLMAVQEHTSQVKNTVQYINIV